MSADQESFRETFVSQLGAMADKAHETEVLQLMLDIEEGYDNLEVYIDRANHDDADSMASATNRVNELCRNLGVNPEKWFERFIGGDAHNDAWQEDDWRPSDLHLRHAARVGTTVGELLLSSAYNYLPIEREESGDSAVSVSLTLGDEHILKLNAEGTFWTDRYYDETDPNADPDDGFVKSEIGGTIDCRAQVKKLHS